MPNNYFSFKQFTVYQDKCAMKVCTDACIQGAFTATLINGKTKNILDIGSGTGLLSLMLAQHSIADITAIETDENAFLQTRQNFNSSEWKHRLHAVNGDVLKFHQRPFDCIICNPPFYENDLISPDKSKNAAMHSTTLKLNNLLLKINELLADDGIASLMLPYHRNAYFKKLLSENHLLLHQELSVQQTPAHGFFRSIFVFGKLEVEIRKQTLIIKENEQYTEAFRELLEPYYLNL